jgi:hypothetical protein
MAAKKRAKRAKKTAAAKSGEATPKTTPAPRTGRRGGRRGLRGPRAGSKTAFILGLPMDMPAREVVEAAAKAGHTLDPNFVYAVRSNARSKGNAPQAAPDVNAPGVPRWRLRRGGGAAALSASGGIERQFQQLAAQIGVARAQVLLREVQDKLARLF